jgi:hypothetical protein
MEFRGRGQGSGAFFCFVGMFINETSLQMANHTYCNVFVLYVNRFPQNSYSIKNTHELMIKGGSIPLTLAPLHRALRFLQA